MKLPTLKGMLDVLSIQSHDGVWEDEWEPLRGTAIGNLVSVVSRAQMDHVLNGYSRPFVDALGIPPEGALLKLPSQRCHNEATCRLYDEKNCVVISKNLPWCYEPAELGDITTQAKSMGAQAVFLWREKVHLVVVDNDA